MLQHPESSPSVVPEQGGHSVGSARPEKGSDDKVCVRACGDVWSKSHRLRPLEIASSVAKISPPVTFHVLQHTHGSHLAMEDVPFGMIARQLGHSDDGKTLRSPRTKLYR